MARIPRLINPSEPTVYHLMSRTALDGFPLGDVEKDYLLDLIKKTSKLYFVDVLGFVAMSNHFPCFSENTSRKCFLGRGNQSAVGSVLPGKSHCKRRSDFKVSQQSGQPFRIHEGDQARIHQILQQGTQT